VQLYRGGDRLENVSNKNTFKVNRCIISTGLSSNSYLTRYASDHVEESISICNCSDKEEISKIVPADHYDIIINYSDKAVEEIIYDLFSFLIPHDVPIRVIFILDKTMSSSSMPKHVTFLEKLEKHKFITLEFIDDSPSEPVKQEENIIYFVGPGNTGKTSIIASLSESFRQNNQKLALIDITRKNKLINYFPKHSFLNTSNLKDFSISRDFYRSVNIYTDGLVDLYVYDYEYDKKGPEVIYFCEILRKLSELYDYIIVNADESSVISTPYIYKTASKVFVVHDFMPTKIRTTKKLFLKMISAGIDTQKTVSLIYNKTLKDTIDIGSIEEKLIFIKLPKKRILPAVNIDCNTFEIPYEQKTMAAMIKNLAASTTGIEDTSKKYRHNIQNIYKYINNIPYTENDEMEISQFLKEKFQKLTDSKYIISTIKNIKTEVINLKNSRIVRKGSNLLCAGKVKLKGSRIMNLKFERLNMCNNPLILIKKYFNTDTKKQQ
jgi:GTPase SAR1 family protein